MWPAHLTLWLRGETAPEGKQPYWPLPSVRRLTCRCRWPLSPVSFPQSVLELCDLVGQLIELSHHLGSVWTRFLGCTCALAVQKALGQGAGQQGDEADAGGHHDGCHKATQG